MLDLLFLHKQVFNEGDINSKDKINILAPEIILLYKSRNYANCDYQHDFDVVINKLEKHRYEWFINAMNIAYPNGHPWIKEIA